MEPEVFVDILSDALFLVIKLVAAIVVPGLLVGLVVAVFQAATSINEQTLSFLPRLIITILARNYQSKSTPSERCRSSSNSASSASESSFLPPLVNT